MSDRGTPTTRPSLSNIPTPVERIGDTNGRIALYLDKQGALDLAATFGPSDTAYDELMVAVSRAYPEIEDAR